jgi:hypothetical protein
MEETRGYSAEQRRPNMAYFTIIIIIIIIIIMTRYESFSQLVGFLREGTAPSLSSLCTQGNTAYCHVYEY